MSRREVAVAFGRLLKTLRDRAELSQEDLAERAELDRTYPSLLERGLRCPTLDVLLRLADALKIDAGWMVKLTVRRLTPEAES